MALLEAVATGLPIVATEVSGTVQAIIPDESGLLVLPGEVKPLADALALVLDDPQHALSMGDAARRRVIAEFSAQRQAKEHLALLYRRLPGTGTRRWPARTKTAQI